MNRRTVCSNAWDIARLAAQIFDGRASQYIAEALRMAWQGVNLDAYLEILMPSPKMVLTGTPHQIAEAEKIVAASLKRTRKETLSLARDTGHHLSRAVAAWADIIKGTEDITTAAQWIDKRSKPLVRILRDAKKAA